MSEQQQHTATIEELYLREKKKSMIFMLGTAVFAVLFVGSLVLGGKSDSSVNTAITDPTTQTNGQQRGPGGRGGLAITQFFNEDGSVNQTEINTLVERSSQGGGAAGADSSQFFDRIIAQIDAAVQSGEITQTQADALQSALTSAQAQGA